MYLRPHRQMSHLCWSGKCPHMTNWLCHHTGSSRWSPALWWVLDSPCNPRFVQLCGSGPHDSRNPHDRPHHECDKGKQDGHAGDTLGQCPGSLPFAVQWATATVEDDKVATKVLDPTGYDEIVTIKDSEMIDAFSSKIIHARMKTAFTGARLNVMNQALHAEEGSLLKDLMIQNAYTRMCNGSKNVTVMVRNAMAYPQTLKKIPLARVVAANCVPEVQMWPGMMDALDEVQGIQTPKMTTEQRQEKMFKKLDLSSLGTWLPELADSACSLLAEYHDIFSLEILWAQLHLFDGTCDQSHGWHPI